MVMLRSAQMKYPIRVMFVYSPHENSHTGGPQMMGRFLRRIDRSRFHSMLLAQCEDALVEELRSRDGIETIVLATPGRLNVFRRRLLRGGVFTSVFRFVALIDYWLRAYNLFRRVKPDLVWCQNLRALLSVAPAARLAYLPVIWQIGKGHPSQGMYGLINDIALRLSNAIWIESAVQICRLFARKQQQAHDGKFMVLRKGIDLDRFDPVRWAACSQRALGVPPEAYIVGTVGALTRRKGYDVLIEAIARLKPMECPLHLVVVGGDPDESQTYHNDLLRRVSDMGLEGRVHFIGFRDDIPQWLAGFDLFVLPSMGEGISGALREAMAMALPVVATDVGGTPDAIENKVDGLLVPPGDPVALAEAIDYLRQRPELSATFGQHARETARRLFSVKDHVLRYQLAFEALLATGEVGTPAERLARRSP